MKRASFGLALICAALSAVSVASAQQGVKPKAETPAIEKPKAPAKPVVPMTKPSAPKPAATGTGPAVAFSSELQSLSVEARAFATSKLSAMTPALRVQAASKVVGKAVPLSAIPQTWIATAEKTVTPYLWLGGKGVNLVTGPDVEAMFQVAGGEGPERGVWVQFNAEAGVRYVLVCDMTGPSRWDLVADSRTRTPMTVETETRGIAVVAARSTSAYQRLLLVVARPLQTGPGSSVMEVLRRCEVTAIRA